MMTNAYHSDIVQILLRSGSSGLPVAEISRIIYNKHAELFDEELTFDSIHQTLRCYLWRQIHYRHSPFFKVKYGVYAIKADMALQMDIDFDNPLPPLPTEEEIAKEEEEDKMEVVKANEPDPRQLLLFPEFF